MTDHSIQNIDAAIDDDGDAAVEHGSSDKTYVMVAIFLAVMTAIEVTVSYTREQLGPLHDWALIILMIVKFVCVALYFMHLKFDKRIAKQIFFFGVIVASLIYAGMLGTFQYWAPGFR